MIHQIAESSKPYDTGFLLEIIDNSKYLRIMNEKYKNDLRGIINEESSKINSSYSDPFFATVIQPELMEELFCNLEQLVHSESQN